MKTKRPSHNIVKYAGVSRRLLSSMVDGAIMSTLFSVFFGSSQFQILKQMQSITSSSEFEALQASAGSGNQNMWSAILGLVYFAVMVVNYDGATIGMRLMAIKLINADGSDSKVSYLTAIVRSLSSYLSAAVFGLGYLSMLGDKKKRTWHDRIAKTLVVETNQKPKRAVSVIVGILFSFFVIGMMGMGFIMGSKFISSEIKKELASDSSNSTYSEMLSGMDEVAKDNYNQSEELFKQMRENGDNSAAVKKLNNQNIRLLWEALELEPKNPILWSQLASAYTWVSDEGSLEDGLDAAQKALEFDPDSQELMGNLGDYYIRLAKYDDAVLILKKAIRLDDDNALVHQNLARAYRQLGLNDDAIVHYKKAIELYEKSNSSGKYDEQILSAQKGLSEASK